jgi:hypothetical protein
MATNSRSATSAQTTGHDRPERVTVNLTSRASLALEKAVRITGDTKTDTINRALQIYAYLEEVQASGATIYVRGKDDAALERLHIIG